MISSKVVITYRRKRTSSRLEPGCGTQCAYSTSEFPSDNLATRLGQHDESSKKYSPENQEEDAGLCIKCFDLGGILLHCGSCYRTCHLQCIDPLLKHLSHEQWLCTACTEQQSSRNSLEHQLPESGTQMARSGLTDNVLLSMNHGEGSDKETGSSLQADVYLKSGSICKSASPETVSVSQFEDVETKLKAKSVCVGSSVEKNCSSYCPSAEMENPDSLSKDRSCLTCSDELMKKKCSTPLITFCRRTKKKKDVRRTDTENNSVVEEKKCAGINYCSSAIEIGSKHDTPLNCISVSQLTAVISSRQDPDMRHLQDEIFNEGASATSTSADSQKDSQIKCAGTSSTIMGLVVNGDEQCKLTEVAVSVGEEFQSVENVGSEGAVSGVTASMGHLDLSVAPPDSCGIVEGTCSDPPINAASETLLDIPNSASPDHATDLHKEKTKRGSSPVLLDSSNKAVQGRPSSDTHAGRSSCINTKEHGNNSKDYGKASTLLPMDNCSRNRCQQNFYEDLMNETAPLACRPSEVTVCVDSSLDKSGCKYDLCNQMSTKSFLCPPLFLGLSLPMEPDTAVSASKDCSSMLSFPSFRSRDIQNLPPHSMPDQSSIQRHKLMLDGIVTRARALQGNQGCWLDKFKGSATAWSEEELDSLWIGVRRHGRGNWDTILRDPRLHFSVWRVAKDLAEQWDDEQTKLLSSMLIQPGSFRNSLGHTQGINSGLFSETRVASNRYGSLGMGNCMPLRSQALMDETQLSLGNVYGQRERSYPYCLPSQYTMRHTQAENSPDKVSSVLNSDLRNTVLQKMSNKQLQKNIRGQRNRTYPNRKRLRYRTDVSFFEQNHFDKSGNHDGEVRTTSNHSLLPDHPPTGSSVQGNLPHWLREVIRLPPPRPTDPALPHPVSQVSLLYDDHQQLIPPFGRPGELPLPQTNPHQGLKKNEINCKFGSHATSDIQSSNLCLIGSRFGPLSMTGSSSIMPEAENQILNGRTDLNPACSYSTGKTKDLIVIDSDASSEETISDDQSGRP